MVFLLIFPEIFPQMILLPGFYLKQWSLLLCASLCSMVVWAQVPSNGVDVKHYYFRLGLYDTTNTIKGEADIIMSFTRDVPSVQLDLVRKNAEGKGMTISSVTKNQLPVSFEQDPQHLIIHDKGMKGIPCTYTIRYEGIPADGLIISKTKYGDRSFFADNWPNRAHNWIPCNDHPSDKATVEFEVTAPARYQVISNGRLAEEVMLPDDRRLSHWKEEALLPTKVMVIGVTRFAIRHAGQVDCIPVSSWVYPADREAGFKSYRYAPEILEWYIHYIGPYGFEKLANVQSKTIFGGMENAGCIFYFENSVTSEGIESLMAHEIAHQWFGDHATEKDWPHLWLSEGFATYMTDLFFESKYGADTLRALLSQQREQVLDFYKKYKAPVVDTSGSGDLMHLLNANSYQKGGWTLHMLRRKVGDHLFREGIRAYYHAYAGGNAGTDDLKKIFEKVTGKDLGTFFKQWLYMPGHPQLAVSWRYHKSTGRINITIRQTQQDLFDFPLKVEVQGSDKKMRQTIRVKDRVTQKEIPLDFVPAELLADPDVDLLFEGSVQKL